MYCVKASSFPSSPQEIPRLQPEVGMIDTVESGFIHLRFGLLSLLAEREERGNVPATRQEQERLFVFRFGHGFVEVINRLD